MTGEFPGECLGILGKACLADALISEVQGDSEIGRRVFPSIVQELAGACARTALVYESLSIVAKALDLCGTEASKEKWRHGMATNTAGTLWSYDCSAMHED